MIVGIHNDSSLIFIGYIYTSVDHPQKVFELLVGDISKSAKPHRVTLRAQSHGFSADQKDVSRTFGIWQRMARFSSYAYTDLALKKAEK